MAKGKRQTAEGGIKEGQTAKGERLKAEGIKEGQTAKGERRRANGYISNRGDRDL